MSVKGVKVWFVRDSEGSGGSESLDQFGPPPDDVRQEMDNAFLICEQYKSEDMEADWIDSSFVADMPNIDKRDVFVLGSFAGPLYNRLVKTKAVIVGPRCLACCLTEGSEIPPGPHPVYTIAMRGLIVSITSLSADVKKKLGQKISWMGGKYETILTAETTHLISNSVISEKYSKAVSLDIPIMQSSWVEAAWSRSLTQNVSASGTEFDVHRLPIFHNLQMCTTGLKKAEKTALQSLVTEHGGKLVRVLDTQNVNLLIADRTAIGSDKFKAAQTYDITCITPEWIHKSVEKGYPVPFKDYIIQNNKTSSPNRPSQLPNMSLDVSAIPNLKNETGSTIYSDLTTASTPMNKIFTKKGRPNKLSAIAKELSQLVDAIEMKEVKLAGQFLDGCCIFVYGLNTTRREKIQRVVGRAGAVCYNQPNEGVTHALCGDPSATNASYNSAMPRALHVSIRWLTDSLAAKKAVDEAPYAVLGYEKITTNGKNGTAAAASPMSKRNLQLLRTPTKRPPVPKFNLDTEEDKDEIVQQYLDHHKSQTLQEEKDKTLIEKNNISIINKKQNHSVKNVCDEIDHNKENSNHSENDEMEEQIFEGITFEIQDIEDETEQITQRILNSGGIVVPTGGSYIIVPINCDEEFKENDNSQIVTTIWLEDCFLKEKIVDVDYYHKPIKIDAMSKPLNGLVFAISTYTGNEREYIMEVAALLGGVVQASLHRRTVKNALRSTHLICSEASGAKYNGAIGWGIPVVTAHWLLECAAQNKRVSEVNFSVSSKDINDMTNSDTITTNNLSKNVMDFPNQKENESVNENKNLVKNSTPLQRLSMRRSDDTPKSHKKLQLDDNAEMSPASRYIAMARQGLFGPESQVTPKRVSEAPLPGSQQSTTPPLDNALSTPNIALFSPADRRRLMAIKNGQRPSNPPCTPKNPFEISVDTPESPFGKIFKREDGTSLNDKNNLKRLWKLCEKFDPPSENQNKKSETPISEMCRKYVNQYLDEDTASNSKLPAARSLEIKDVDTPPAKIRKLDSNDDENAQQLQNQLKQLTSILAGTTDSNDSTSNTTPRSLKAKRSLNVGSPALSLAEKISPSLANNAEIEPVESQVDTVKWDDMSESGFSVHTEIKPTKVYRFMLSLNVENCDEFKKIIERLGGTVLESTGLELSATHLLCSRVVRSEKFLGCLASGRWILHPSYIIKSQEAGRFVDEELFEWGNPKAENLLGKDENERKFAASVHRWRSKITETGVLPFSSFRVIMHIQEDRKIPLIRVLLAGGGKMINATTPFSGEINATHCLMEQKRMPLSHEDMVYLAARRIPVCPPLLLNSILVEDPPPDATEYACPDYKKLIK